MGEKPACRYCGKRKTYSCVNSRDLEDFAISGDSDCFAALETIGWGEKGERYVRLNRDATRRAALQERPSHD